MPKYQIHSCCANLTDPLLFHGLSPNQIDVYKNILLCYIPQLYESIIDIILQYCYQQSWSFLDRDTLDNFVKKCTM